MGAPEIPFNPDTARKVKETFNKAAGKLKDQVGGRNGAADTILKDFKGPYATVYTTNKDTVSGDSNELAGAMEQVAYIMDRAIEAYEEAKADAEKSDWENFKEDVKEFFGAGEQEEVPPAPALPSASTPSTSSKETPTGQAGQESVVSGVPSNMREGTQTLKGFDGELTTFPGDMKSALEAYASECTWAPITVGNIPDQLDKWLKDNSKEQEWLNKIADEFERISGNAQQVSTVPTSAMEAAVGNANSHLRADLKVDTPTIQGSEAAAGYIGDPVNAATGNFIEPETDLAFTGASSALSITRMYNALNRTSGVFGLGWSSSLDMRLILTDENATWIKEDGQHLIFPRRGDGWERADAHALWLTKEAPESLPATFSNAVEYLLVVRDNQGSWWAFDTAGYWVGHGESTGNIIMVERGEHQEVTRIQHARGRFIDIEYADSKVAYVQSNDGTRVEYIYDEVGKLTGARTAADTRHYDYNEQDLISAVTAADGTVEVENFYDALGRVRSQRYPHGVVRKYSYLSGGVTLVTNEDGSHANSWISDAKGRLVGMIDANQNRQSMAYDTFSNRVSVTERDGSMTVRAYNKRGLLTREVTPEGADATYEWDAHDRPKTLITTSGAVISYEYADETGAERNPSTLVDALGGHTQMNWENGLLTSMVGPTGVSVTCAYDAYGEMTAITNALGETTRFERDGTGRIQRIITPLGLTTTFTYDAAGLLVARQEADGALWRFGYSTGGRLHTVTDPTGAVTAYEYNTAGEIARVIDPLGRTTTHDFDAMGNLASITDPAGSTWSLVYDQLMQNTALIDPLGHRWSREYDINGELASVTDPTGVRTTAKTERRSGIHQITDAFGTHTTTFDAYGRPTKATGADGSEEVYTHDAAGNIVEILDAEGHLTTITRDARGEITAITTPEGRTTTFTYDECGRPLTMTEPTGVVTTLEYDADSRVITRSTTAGVREEITYDKASRIISQRTNTGTARYGYDVCGRLTFATDLQFGTRRFAYDQAGQLTCATNGLGGKTRYTYTPNGQVATITAPNGAVTSYEYDAAGQLVTTVDPLGRRTTGTYDAAGRLLSTTNPDGDELAYTYDAGGLLATTRFNQRLVSRVERDVRARTTCVLDYTQPGTSLTNENTGTPVVHTLATDRLGQLIERTTTGSDSTDQQVRITYTPDGARSHMVVNGQTTDYTYDEGTGLLTTLMRTRSADNAVGEKGQSQSVPSVLESLTYHYDTDARLTSITDNTGTVLRAFNTVPTVVEASTTGAQEADASYVTDGGWATIEHRHVDGQQQSVTTYYNAQGLVIGVDDTADGLRLLTYDDAHQLTAVMTDHGTHRFTYDTAGFLIGEETTTGVVREYTYDAAGQLVRLEDSQVGVSQYVYDGLGRRVQHTDHTGAVSTYAYSPVGLLAEITGEDRDAVYLWNDALGQVAAVATSTADTGSTGADSADDSHSTMMCTLTWDPVAFTPTVLGVNNTPVSLSTSASVDVLGGRGVDPFDLSPVVAGFTTGSGVGSDVSSDTQGLFATASIPGVPGLGLTRAGSVQVAGLEILGARAYDATTRGFMTPDPLVSPVGAGWGANVYSFAGNDPVSQVDPWGLSPMTATQFREYRQDTSARAIERMGKGLADFADRNAGWIALGVAAVGVAALAVSGPIGWGILTGMALSGGIELGSQLLSGEPLDWKKIAKSASIGGIAGGLGAGVAGLATKVGSKIFTSIASKYSTQAGAVNQQMSQVFRNVATNPATKNAVPKIVTGLKRTQQSLMGNAQRYSSFASKVGSAGAREGVAAYVEAGTDTTLTYMTDGHHVTGRGLVAAWGVPAVSNAVLPKPVSKGFDGAFQKLGWQAAEGVSAKVRSGVSDAVGNFTNGAVSYSGAPMTYSPQYESFQGKDYEGPGWNPRKAFESGLKETVKGGASSSQPVESLKAVSFEAKPVSSGLDYAGMARDSAMLSTGASGVEVSVASIYQHEKGTTNE